MLRTFGCADLTNHTGFSLLLGTFANQIQYDRQDQTPQPINPLKPLGLKTGLKLLYYNPTGGKTGLSP